MSAGAGADGDNSSIGAEMAGNVLPVEVLLAILFAVSLIFCRHTQCLPT